jgi:hypothetical protein
MSTVDKAFFEKFRRQAPVKSVVAKMIKKFHETEKLRGTW